MLKSEQVSERKWFAPAVIGVAVTGSIISFLTSYPQAAVGLIMCAAFVFGGDKLFSYYHNLLIEQKEAFNLLYQEHKKECDSLIERYKQALDDAILRRDREAELKHDWAGVAHIGMNYLLIDNNVFERVKTIIPEHRIIEVIDTRIKQNEDACKRLEDMKTR